MEENKEQKEFVDLENTQSYLHSDFGLMCMLMMILATNGTNDEALINTYEVKECKKKLRDLMGQFSNSLDKMEEQCVELQKFIDGRKEKEEELTIEELRNLIEEFISERK